ncbi:MAG: DUF4199 family protein [Niastella sp.]|nr:DUF4199 family protein [Niastella sp.]
MERKTTSAVTIGLLASLVLIVLALVIYFANLYTERWIQYVSIAIFGGSIIWGVVNHGKETGYQATFGGLFGFGFKIVAVITVLMVAYTIAQGFLFPEIKEKFVEQARIEAAKNPNADPNQIEQGIQWFEKNFTMFMIFILLFWYVISGAIAALIGAAVTKKKTPFENSFNQ